MARSFFHTDLCSSEVNRDLSVIASYRWRSAEEGLDCRWWALTDCFVGILSMCDAVVIETLLFGNWNRSFWILSWAFENEWAWMAYTEFRVLVFICEPNKGFVHWLASASILSILSDESLGSIFYSLCAKLYIQGGASDDQHCFEKCWLLLVICLCNFFLRLHLEFLLFWLSHTMLIEKIRVGCVYMISGHLIG